MTQNRPKVRFTVEVDPAHDFVGFLDMLRYDEAVVRDWGRAAANVRGTFVVTLLAERITIDRWRSFCLVPQINGHPVEV